MNTDAQDAFARGELHTSLGEYQKAIDDYTEAIRLVPDNPDSFNGRAITYHELGEHQKAIDDYTKAIQLQPDSPGTFYDRAVQYIELEEYTEAWRALEKSLSLDAENPFIHHLRGELWYIDGDLDQSIACFEQALSFAPDFEDSRISRMEVYREPKVWWIFNRRGSYIGNIMKDSSGRHSGQVGRDRVNQHFDQMIRIFESSSGERVDNDHSVVFQRIELEECIDGLREIDLILTVDQDGPPWDGIAWLKSLEPEA